MDFINFKVGSKTIALKILDILLTERYEHNLTELPNKNKSFVGVKDYLGSPTPIFDLGMVLNEQSTQAANKALSSLLEDKEKDQQQWLDRLETSIKEGVYFDRLTNKGQETNSQWFNDFKTDNEDLEMILSKFNKPHSELNSAAIELLELCEQGQKDKAMALFQEKKRKVYTVLNRLFESAREQITLNYKPIIIFTTKDGKTPHVGLLVDKVEDSLSVSKEQIKPLEQLTSVGFEIDEQTRHMMRGLINIEDKHSIIIDPSVIFVPEQSAV